MPNRSSRKNRTNRYRRKHTGGAAGSGWAPGGPLLPGTQLDAQVNTTYDACLSAPRPGQIAFSAAGGLPGMRGGAYTNNLSNTLAGFPIIDKVGCTSNYVNPQNQGYASTTNYADPSKYINPLNLGRPPHMGGGPLTGGGSCGRSNFAQAGGVGLQSAKDMGVYEAPTARYTQMGSEWKNSVGAPVLLNQPINSTLWSKACNPTGGRRNRSRRNRRNRSRRNNGNGSRRH